MLIVIILLIIILIYFVIISLVFSNIVVNVEECDISYNDNQVEGWFVKDFKLSIQIYIFKFIKILNIKILKNSIQIFKLSFNINIENKIKNNKNLYEVASIDAEVNKNLFNNIKLINNNKSLINIKNLKPIITNLNLDLSFGTENSMLTTFSIPTISFIVSFLLSNSIYKYDSKNYNYRITPKYIDTNNFKIELNAKLKFNTLRLLFFIIDYRKIKSNA